MPLVPSRSHCLLSLLLTLTALRCLATAGAAEPNAPVRPLSDFGDVGPKTLAETYQNAMTELRKSGGVLSISAEEWKQLQGKLLPLQGLTRSPEPPAETKRWTTEPGVTVVSHDDALAIV